MKRRAVFWLFGGSVVVIAVACVVVVASPGRVGAITNDVVRKLLNGVDGNAMLAQLIVPARPTLPSEGLRKLETRDWTNPPEMAIPTDEQQADLGLILWRQQLNEIARFGANRYVAVPGSPVGASDLLAMTNESYRMIGVQAPRVGSPLPAGHSSATPKGAAPRTHAQTREKGPLSPDQLKAIHAAKRK